MAKVRELEQSCGAFEVGWWHAGTNQQIRFNGTAHLYRRNAPIEFPEARLKQYIHTAGDWTWEAERDRLWNSHRPGMRGSFRNPHPGTPMNAEKQKKLQVVELDEEDDGPDAREAKDRFTLVVLEVMEIEILDLDPPPVLPCCSPFDRLLTPCVRAKDVDGHCKKIARTLRIPHGMLRNYVPNSAPTFRKVMGGNLNILLPRLYHQHQFELILDWKHFDCIKCCVKRPHGIMFPLDLPGSAAEANIPTYSPPRFGVSCLKKRRPCQSMPHRLSPIPSRLGT